MQRRHASNWLEIQVVRPNQHIDGILIDLEEVVMPVSGIKL